MRECGFYWVKFMSDTRGEIAYWNGIYWAVTDSENHYDDEDFAEIDENQIRRKNVSNGKRFKQ